MFWFDIKEYIKREKCKPRHLESRVSQHQKLDKLKSGKKKITDRAN